MIFFIIPLAGETMRLSPGCIVAFESSINFDVTMLSGAKNIIFGGEGLFLSTLTGPGTVWIQVCPQTSLVCKQRIIDFFFARSACFQSLPFDRVVDSIAHQLGHGGYNPAMLAAMGMAGMGGSPPPTPSSTPGAAPTSGTFFF